MALCVKHVARDREKSLKILDTSLHISFKLVVKTVLHKFKDHESSVNRIQRNTHEDQLTDINTGG